MRLLSIHAVLVAVGLHELVRVLGAQLLLGLVCLAHAGQCEQLGHDRLVRRARALASFVKRRAPVVVPFQCALRIAGNDGAHGIEMAAHRGKVQRLITSLAALFGRIREGGECCVHDLEGCAPPSSIVQRQPALPRVVLLLEQARLLTDEAQLLVYTGRRVAEEQVERIGRHRRTCVAVGHTLASTLGLTL